MAILYIVATQYDNLGDLVINKCLIDKLSTFDKVYLDLKNVNSNFKQQLLSNNNILDLKSHNNSSLKGIGAITFPICNRLDFNHLFKSPGPFGGVSDVKDFIHQCVFVYIFKLFYLKNITIQLIGNDLIINNKIDLIFFKIFSKYIKIFYVRSILNKKLFNKLGINNIEYLPDLSFLLYPSIKNTENFQKRKIIGMSFRDLNDSKLNLNLIKSIEVIINYYNLNNYSIEIFYQVQRDKDFNKYIYNNFKSNSSIIFYDEQLKYENINQYLKYDYVISNRLHVLLLGQLHNSIPIAILHSKLKKTDKISNVYKSIGLNELIFETITNKDLDAINKNYISIISIIKEKNKKEYYLLNNYFNNLLL